MSHSSQDISGRNVVVVDVDNGMDHMDNMNDMDSSDLV